MKPQREHLTSGARHEDRTAKTTFFGSAALAGLSGAGAVAALVVGSPVAVVAGLIAAGSGAFAAVKFKELKTWGNPEVTLAFEGPDGQLQKLYDDSEVELGARIVGNYRRQALVDPVPEARLSGRLVLTELSSSGSGEHKRNFEERVLRRPVAVTPNVNDGVLDIDFEVTVPIANVAPTMELGRNRVEWHLELALDTGGPNDSHAFGLVVVPVISHAAPSASAGPSGGV